MGGGGGMHFPNICGVFFGGARIFQTAIRVGHECSNMSFKMSIYDYKVCILSPRIRSAAILLKRVDVAFLSCMV